MPRKKSEPLQQLYKKVNESKVTGKPLPPSEDEAPDYEDWFDHLTPPSNKKQKTDKSPRKKPSPTRKKPDLSPTRRRADSSPTRRVPTPSPSKTPPQKTTSNPTTKTAKKSSKTKKRKEEDDSSGEVLVVREPPKTTAHLSLLEFMLETANVLSQDPAMRSNVKQKKTKIEIEYDEISSPSSSNNIPSPSPPIPLPKPIPKKLPDPPPIEPLMVDLTSTDEPNVVEFWLSRAPPQIARPKPKSKEEEAKKQSLQKEYHVLVDKLYSMFANGASGEEVSQDAPISTVEDSRKIPSVPELTTPHKTQQQVVESPFVSSNIAVPPTSASKAEEMEEDDDDGAIPVSPPIPSSPTPVIKPNIASSVVRSLDKSLQAVAVTKTATTTAKTISSTTTVAIPTPANKTTVTATTTTTTTTTSSFDDFDDIDLSIIDNAEAAYYKKKEEEEKKKMEVEVPKPAEEPKPSLRLSGSIMTSYAPVPSTTLGSPPKSPSERLKKYHRLLVLEINNPTNFEKAKILRCFDEANMCDYFITLAGDWYFQTKIKPGDFVNLIGKFDDNGHCRVDDGNKHYLILHPDILITGTSLADCYGCMRKTVLNHKVKRVQGESSGPLIYGEMVHELFEHAIRYNDFTDKSLNIKMNEIIQSRIEQLFLINETIAKAQRFMKEHIKNMQNFSRNFIGRKPKNSSVVSIESNNNKRPLSIYKVLGIEEEIWSPTYGIKGIIDVSVESKVQTGQFEDSLVVPLEIKTGKAQLSHSAQVMLYTLLMSDYYGVPIKTGLLYYTKDDTVKGVPPDQHQLRSLLLRRNELAYYFHNEQKLPEPLKKAYETCKKCDQQDHCMVYWKSMEGGKKDFFEDKNMETLFEKHTQHLTQTHIDYFNTWDRLIDLEKRDSLLFRKEIWSLTSEEREKIGRCFSQMILIRENQSDGKFQYTFKRSTDMQEGGTSLLDLSICVSDYVLLSTERGHYALGSGTVQHISQDTVIIESEEELKCPPIPIHATGFTSGGHFKQEFQGIMDIEDLGNVNIVNRHAILGTPQSLSQVTNIPSSTVLWRIDKDELITGIRTIKDSLMHLFTEDGDHKRRRLIVDLEPPQFSSTVPTIPTPRKKNVKSVSQSTPTSSQSLNYSDLNVDQRRAANQVLTAMDYALILGMPGTGKTTTIAYIIQMLVERGKTILLTSYTHNAVDNLLFKLKDLGIDFLRIGRPQQVNSGLKKYLLDWTSIKSPEDLERLLKEKKIVATTCLGIQHPIFAKKKFDYCIVDEASQITQAVCLGPLRYADIFVLVGDHYQLPPLIRNEEAKESGMDVSLFKRLSEAHPQVVVNLEYQYRMNKDIMLLSNVLVYNHRLRCGTPAVADKKIKLNMQALPLPVDPLFTHWLKDVLNPERRVVFINTDQVPALETRSGEVLRNDVEASLVTMMVQSLVLCGIAPSAIGVISPYRTQLSIIRHRLGPSASAAIEVHTVDKFQGRDKDCILLSLVRSNANKTIGELLRDWRRVNVAFTRAKKKLLIIGSASTIEENHLFAQFLQIVKNENWEYKLPETAHSMYKIPQIPEEKFMMSQSPVKKKT